MKVQCEYCQNMVEVQPGVDKVCPFCGGPLPAAPEPPRTRPAPRPQAAKPKPLLIALLLFVLLAAGGILYLNSRPDRQVGDPSSDLSMPNMRLSDALDAISEGTADGGAYMVAINYYLEGGKADTAYQACKDLLELPDGGTYMSWCVQELGKFSRPDLAARLAMAADARSGSRELYELVQDTALDQLLPDSPLCQAMELVLGRTAANITLADLQAVTGVSIGRRDSLSGAQEIGVAFDEAGREFVTVTVEYTGSGSGLGTVCFQGLRTFLLSDSNIRTKEDLTLPNLRELRILLQMDGSDLTKFTHLKNLERLTLDSDELIDSQDDLRALTSLRSLKLRVSKNLSFLSPLTDLEELTIYSYIASWDISGASQFRNLKKLSLSSGSDFYDGYTAELEGLDALRDLPLEELDLSGKPVYGNINAVLEIPTLQVLKLNGTHSEGTDYAKFANLTQLRELDLGNYRDMVDTPPDEYEQYWSYKAGPASVFVEQLEHLTGLERLNLSGCGVEDISSLRGLAGLTWLDLSDTDISDLSPLADLTNLTYLKLTGNRIGDYSPVEGRDGLTLIR